MTTHLALENVGKTFAGNVVAVHDVTLTIPRGEFVTLLGPSGCGKTTTLRMIAGFERPTRGSIVLAGRTLASVARGVSLPPEQRGMGMVFQSYAVWPHMTVLANVAYPLRFGKRGKRSDMQAAARNALALVQLEAYADRYPHQLSGGQQQRVALARALVMEPAVLLLDEPLSNLDAKLREVMRFEIVALQRRLGVTVVYVTHDQAEAMAMSDRVVVMNRGVVQQVGPPRTIYTRPANRFVADFIGVANLLPCRVVARDGEAASVLVGGHTTLHALAHTGAPPDGEALLMVRPEHITLHDDAQGLPGTLTRVTYLGDRADALIALDGGLSLRATLDPSRPLAEGAPVHVGFSQAYVLPREG